MIPFAHLGNVRSSHQMFLRRIRPRLWWLLVIPLCFYLTRKAYVYAPPGYNLSSSVGYTDIQNAEQIVKNEKRAKIESYLICGCDVEYNTYQVMNFIAISTLVIGCFSLGKEILLGSTK
jgi:hypothetical protein